MHKPRDIVSQLKFQKVVLIQAVAAHHAVSIRFLQPETDRQADRQRDAQTDRHVHFNSYAHKLPTGSAQLGDHPWERLTGARPDGLLVHCGCLHAATVFQAPPGGQQ